MSASSVGSALQRVVVVLVLLLLLGSLTVLAAYAWLDRQWQQRLSIPNEGVSLTVNQGDSLGKVLNRAAAAGWLVHPRWIGFVAAQRQLDEKLHVGQYHLASGMTVRGLIERLASGDVVRYQVTLPEGIRLAQAIDILCGVPTLACTLSGADDARLLALTQPYVSAEGWFLPETYSYVQGDTDLDVLRQANQLLIQTLDTLWKARDVNLPLADPFAALTLASIIEKETGIAEERPEIAGVFVRRLLQGMRLQTDPTVIYGLGDAFTGNLTRRHLKDTSNAYNTYRIDGLPPSPIALPGRSAIAAALQPADGTALYFVAKGDGSHAFSASLEEHEENVRRFQLRRRTTYRSSPP